MKKTLRRFVLLSLSCVFALSMASAQKFTITGTIASDVEGFETGMIELHEFNNLNSVLTQRTEIVDGRFSFTGTTPFPKKFTLFNVLPDDAAGRPEDFAWLMLENTAYEVHITKNNYTVKSNSEEQKRLEQYELLEKNRQTKLAELDQNFNAKMKNSQTEAEKLAVNNWARDIQFQIDSEHNKAQFEWMENNMDSYVGLERFFFGFMRNIRKRQSEDLFAKVPENLHHTEHYLRIKQFIDTRNNIKVGKPLPPATVYDIYGNGHPVLQKGKAQIIFFGVRETYFYKPFQKFTNIYEQYKDKDVQWMAIAKGERNEWIRYLAKDTPPYPVYLTSDNGKFGIFNEYDVSSFPQIIVLDANNNIVLKERFFDINWDEVFNQL